MTTKEISILFMIIAFVAIIGVDIVLAVNRHPGDTFSEILRKVGRECVAFVIIISFGMGLLAGHWWWS